MWEKGNLLLPFAFVLREEANENEKYTTARKRQTVFFGQLSSREALRKHCDNWKDQK